MSIHLVSIAPPYRYGVEDMTRPPSSLLYVGGYLKKHGLPIIVHHINEKSIEIMVDEILSDQECFTVGFSVMTGAQIALSAKASRELKKKKKNQSIVWGGIHPSIMPKETLSYPFVDFIVRGEGEITALELSNYLIQGQENSIKLDDILGIGYKNNHELVFTPPRPFHKPLDDFRQDWSLVNIQRYIRDGDCFCFITSRGCPHECGFCYNQAFNQRRWRAHSVEFVVNELKEIKRLTGIRRVTFDDDNFFTDKKRGLEIIRRLKEIGIECEWVELRCDDINEDDLSEMVKHGVKSIFMGWESGSEKTLAKIAKPYSQRFILEKTKILSQFKELMVDASAIVGFPWEDEVDIRETIQTALKMFTLKPYMLSFNLGIYVPYPGSPIVGEALKAGFHFPQEPEQWRTFDILSGKMRLPWLTSRRVKELTKVDRYLKLLFVPKRVKRPYLRGVRKILAWLAFWRLKVGVFILPFEIWLVEVFYRIDLTRQQKQLLSKLTSKSTINENSKSPIPTQT